MIQMPSLALAAQKIAGFEEFRAKPYRDAIGLPTIGYGTTHYPDNRPVAMIDASISEEAALAFLKHDLNDCALHLWKFIRRQPTLHQWSAMLSLTYNEGWPAISKSTLVTMFNSGEPVDIVAAQFIRWDKARIDGELVEIPGLLSRRRAEAALFLTPDGAV